MAGDAKDRRAGSDSALKGVGAGVGDPGPASTMPELQSECAVQRNRPVRGAAVLVIAHFSTVEIEVPVWLVADLTGERHDRRNLPVKTGASSNLAVRYDCVVEPRHSMRVAKLVVGPESRLRDGCSRIERYIAGQSHTADAALA